MRTCAALFMQVKTFALALELVDTAVREALRASGATNKGKSVGEGRIGLAYWASIVEYVRELSGVRNYLAHVPLVLHARDDIDEVDARIGPPPIAWFAGLGADPRRPPLDVEEVRALGADFHHAHGILVNFYSTFQTHGPLPRRYFEPVARRRPARKQRLESARQAPKTPPRSSPA